MKVSGLRTNARRGGSEARPSTPATGGLFSAGRAPHIAPPRGRRAGTTGTGANLRARRRRPAASTCAPLQKGACAAGTAGASDQGRRPLARSLQLFFIILEVFRAPQLHHNNKHLHGWCRWVPQAAMVLFPASACEPPCELAQPERNKVDVLRHLERLGAFGRAAAGARAEGLGDHRPFGRQDLEVGLSIWTSGPDERLKGAEALYHSNACQPQMEMLKGQRAHMRPCRPASQSTPAPRLPRPRRHGTRLRP